MDLPVVDVRPPAPSAPALPPHHIEVKFGNGISGDAQGRLLLALERYGRETMGIPVEVFKEVMADDLKRRRDMTSEDRKRL